MTSTKLLFDVKGMGVVDAINRIAWRLDPVRRAAQKSDEQIDEIAVVNSDKAVFDDGTTARLGEIAKTNQGEAVQAAMAIMHLLLIAFLVTRNNKGFAGRIKVNPDPDYVKDFKRVDLSVDNPQYEDMKKDITNIEGTTGEIGRELKSILADTLTPLFGNLSASVDGVSGRLSRVGAEMEKRFDDAGADMTKRFDDTTKRFDKIEQLLNNLQPKTK